MNHNPTPKVEFQKNPAFVKNHVQLVEDERLRYSLRVALEEMQRRSAAGTDTTNFNFCAASHLRLLGAQDFIEIFLNLGEQMQPAARTDTANLPGNVSQMPTRKN